MKKLIRKVYDLTLRISAHKHATWGLVAVSFIESSVFPIPPDVVLIPICIAQRRKAIYYAGGCTVASRRDFATWMPSPSGIVASINATS